MIKRDNLIKTFFPDVNENKNFENPVHDFESFHQYMHLVSSKYSYREVQLEIKKGLEKIRGAISERNPQARLS